MRSRGFYEMKKTDDPEKIKEWLEKYHIPEIFDTPDLSFEAFQFEKGELLTTPLKETEYLFFLVEGVVRIYGVLSDGRMIPVSFAEPLSLFGDIEFINYKRSDLFCEAITETVCLALSITRHRALLDSDLKLLHVVLNSLAEKLSMFALLDVGAPQLEERVLVYIKTMCPDNELRGLDASALKLRCSRRQLQRVLKKLCEEGKIKKTGRGKYKL